MMQCVCFHAALMLGGMLRASTYSTVGVMVRGGQPVVRKRRRFYAPLLVWLGRPLMRILNTGVQVLPQPEWALRERQMYDDIHHQAVAIEADGALLLPFLPGATLAAVLENATLPAGEKQRCIVLAAQSLAGFHASGFTHGDAMAENVMVEPASGAARWFDFETVHDAKRDAMWCKADDLRALLTTCLLRTPSTDFAATLNVILEAYGSGQVHRKLPQFFRSSLQRSLALHLGQAPLSFAQFQEIDRLLQARHSA